MKSAKMITLIAGLGMGLFFLSGNVLSADSAMTTIKKKPETTMMKDDAVMQEGAEKMAEPTKPDMNRKMDKTMEQPMNGDMDKSMEDAPAEPDKAIMEKPMDTDAAEPMSGGMEKPMETDKKMSQ